MRTRTGPGVVFAIIVATLFVVAPRPARACGRGVSGGYEGAVVGALLGTVGVITGLPLTMWDLASAGAGEHPSVAYGDVEIVIAAPQLLLGALALRSFGPSGNGLLVGYTVWMGLLLTHGIWTIATASSASTPALEEPPTSHPEPPVPAPLLQVSVGPTYVPVGQLAHPGIGFVGRF